MGCLLGYSLYLTSKNPSLTMADLQALLWYPEKRLYDSASSDSVLIGHDDTSADYANAAVKMAQNKGVSHDAINNALEQLMDKPLLMDAQEEHESALTRGLARLKPVNSRLPDLTNLSVDPAELAFEELRSAHSQTPLRQPPSPTAAPAPASTDSPAPTIAPD